jgi:hypothetical protein
METYTLDQKLHKIQSLFAKGQSTTSDSEAQVCFLKAQELMAKWNIDAAQVQDSSDEKREVVWERVTETGGIKVQWKASLASVIAENFRCKMFYNGKGASRYIVFFGLVEDAKIAHELYVKALKVIRKGQDRVNDYLYHRGLPVQGVRGDYAIGFVKGLKEAFAQQVDEQGWGLIVVTPKEVNEAYAQIKWSDSDWGTSSTLTAGAAWAREEGQKDGKAMIPSQKKRFLEGGE